jgi:peptidoglycan/LPS O-acetylase OafA/YrhL
MITELRNDLHSSNEHLVANARQGQQYDSLDGVRGLAALIVVLWHMPSPMQTLGPRSGYLAVDLFFCLSGFVLTHAYQGKIKAGMSYLEFFKIRIVRLYPIFIFGIGLGALGVAALLMLRLQTN